MGKIVTPMDLALAGLRTWQVQAQSCAVMGLRVAGMAGAWSMPPSEAIHMVAEKQADFAEAGRKMTQAMLAGVAPLAVYGAGLKPVARRTKANVRRLSQ